MTEYIDFYRIIIAYALGAVRIGTALLILPATSTAMITGFARNAAVLSFATFTLPYIMDKLPPGEIPLALLVPAALHEALIGFLLGFFAAIPFWIAENVGNFIDNQRGATMGEVYSPLSGAQVSTTGIFFTQIVSTIFFVGGIVLVFLGAIYASYELFPVFGPFKGFSVGADSLALETLDGMMKTTFIIASPIILLMFLATIGLGFVNRTAPQLNVFFLSMPIKSALGVAMLIIYLQFILDMLMYTDEGAILRPIQSLLN